MEIFFVVLIAGFAAGTVLRSNAGVERISVIGIDVFLFLLILAMGYSLGQNEVIMQSIATIGLDGVLIAAFTVAGSILFVLPLQNLLERKGKWETSLLVLFALAAGIFSGKLGLYKPAGDPAVAEILLYVLLFFIALNLGLSSKKLKTHMRLSFHDVLVPVLVAAGSLAGAWASSLVLNGRYDALEVMAVGSGFGYYSLSSILIMEISGNELAMLALIANLFREMATLVFSPLLARWLGKLAPVASGGATAMDTSLPVIVRSSGKDYTIPSIISGVILSLLVPVIIPLILSF